MFRVYGLGVSGHKACHTAVSRDQAAALGHGAE